MKKIYLKPEIEVVPIDMSQAILAGSVQAYGLDGLAGYEEEDGEAD